MKSTQEARVTFKNDVNKKLKAVGINIYGGGFTYGVLKHFHVLAQIEEFKLGRRTFLLNFPNLNSPFSEHTSWPVKEYVDKVDLVYANPPCVPWSSASSYSARTGQIGTRHGKTIEHRFADPLLALTDNTMKAAVKMRPNVFISESVENAYNTGVRHYDQYVKLWNKAGYHVTFFLTDAVIHGAACRRRRFHFIAHNVALELGNAPSMKNFKATTVRDVIGDLVKRKEVDDGEFQHIESGTGRWGNSEYRHILKSVPEYGMLKAHLPEDFDGPAPSILCRKLSWDIPSPTIMGFNKLIHPDGKRWITIREGMRLMSYPDSFRIAGKEEVAAYDAVIPLIGEMLARVAKKSIEKSGNVKVGHTIVDWRDLGIPFSGKKALQKIRGER